jgi:hypothetical protein
MYGTTSRLLKRKQRRVDGVKPLKLNPDVTENREIMTTHVIDIDKSPAEIVWSKRELTVDERKSGLIGQAKSEFQEVVDAQLQVEDGR